MPSDQAEDAPAWARHIAPNALLLGAVTGFVACCLLGYMASKRPTFANVERFHRSLNYETLFYPTASQVCESVRSQLDRTKILVIIGGSSRLHGTNQQLSDVWTRKLQQELGGQFQVINLAQRGGLTAEFAETVAEMILPEHPRLILLSDTVPGMFVSPNPLVGFYHYFFWDAYYKKRLILAPEQYRLLKEQGNWQDDFLREKGQLIPPNAELRRRMQLDSRLYFTDLWHWIGYEYFFTQWTPGQLPFTKPRRSRQDPDQGSLPVETRFRQSYFEAQMQNLRGFIGRFSVTRDATGQWVPDPSAHNWNVNNRALACSFPNELKPRVMLLMVPFSRYHLRQVSIAEQEKYERIRDAFKYQADTNQIKTVEIGNLLLDEDFNDLFHLAPSGGNKLATVAAPQIRAHASALGFITQ